MDSRPPKMRFATPIFVDRYLYPSGSEILVDANGLLASQSISLWQTNLVRLDSVAKLPGGILISEGGMGKTTFMQQFRDALSDQAVHLFKLGEYVGHADGFSRDLQSIFLASAFETPHTVLFDGLDEAPEIWGALLRSIRQLPNSVSVWISSRDIGAIQAIQKERPELTTYSLAPLSEEDLRFFAEQAAVDPKKFIDAARQQGVLPICAKPLGCELALSVFRANGLLSSAQRDLWKQGIERLCDENPSPTRRLLSAPRFTLKEVVDCAAWISICLALTEKSSVWNGEQSHCPPNSLGISDLTTAHFCSDLIRTTLERGVFSPLGNGRFTFSHIIYRDYLVALGFADLIPAVSWISLLINSERNVVFPQRAGIAPWLAAYNSGFLETLSAIQPELLLVSSDCIQAIGQDFVCNALLNRADSLSFQQQTSIFNPSNLLRLKGDKTMEVLRVCLHDQESSHAAIKVAIKVAEACEYNELAWELAGRVLNDCLSNEERIDAGYAVCKLKNNRANAQLKPLLSSINPEDDPQDELRGLVLRACWPSHLSPEELVECLIRPQKPNYTGAYRFFLNYELPTSLESLLEEKSATVLLDWALPHINEQGSYDDFGRLARAIYTTCWKFSGAPAISERLASGYVSALSEHQSPFILEVQGGGISTMQLFGLKKFNEDINGRLAVLKAILSRKDCDTIKLEYIPFTDCPLYTQDDISTLFNLVLMNPQGPFARELTICIKAVIMRADLDAFTSQVNCLHALYPDLIDSSDVLRANMAAAARRVDEFERLRQQQKNDRNLQRLTVQSRLDNEIKILLQTPGLKPESYINVYSWLSFQPGSATLPSIDIRLSPGWAKLTEEEKSKVLDLALRYLMQGEILHSDKILLEYSVASALTALRLLRPSIYERLSHEVWRKCAGELFNTATHHNIELLEPLFQTLSAHFLEIATDAVLEILSQESQRDYAGISFIRYWGKYLTNDQALGILKIIDTPGINESYRSLLLSNLAEYGQDDLVRKYLDSLFINDWSIPPDFNLHKLRRLAFVLSPVSYIHQILDALTINPIWGRHWIETSIESSDSALLRAINSCDVSEMASFYIWLNDQYPPDQCPYHESVFTPGPLDEIYRFKSHLIRDLAQSGKTGSASSIQNIVERFPSEDWLTHYLRDARIAEHASAAPVLSVEEIKVLYDAKNKSRRLVNSFQDLLELTIESLAAYEGYLHGDTPAVGDLWDGRDHPSPRDEEYLSDHLKRYLELTLTNDIIINREVQIRRKMFRDGTPGSRTDLWIQAFDSNGGVLTLCIEVKCNWNRSAETALKGQLIDKYMTGGTATGGILLLGWFECNSWDEADGRLAKSISTWKNPSEANSDLQAQVSIEQNAGYCVEAMVIDCGLR